MGSGVRLADLGFGTRFWGLGFVGSTTGASVRVAKWLIGAIGASYRPYVT